MYYKLQQSFSGSGVSVFCNCTIPKLQQIIWKQMLLQVSAVCQSRLLYMFYLRFLVLKTFFQNKTCHSSWDCLVCWCMVLSEFYTLNPLLVSNYMGLPCLTSAFCSCYLFQQGGLQLTYLKGQTSHCCTHGWLFSCMEKGQDCVWLLVKVTRKL